MERAVAEVDPRTPPTAWAQLEEDLQAFARGKSASLVKDDKDASKVWQVPTLVAFVKILDDVRLDPCWRLRPDLTPAMVEAAKYTWSWPEREKRAPPPQIRRPEKLTQSFLEEYELRPPWLKY